jgi:putative nucleotidyltransferase with HDIG domain
VIDLAKGGSIQGEIAALNRLVDLAIPNFPLVWRAGGTYVIPGHGRVHEQLDVVEYRDMVTIVRDRVQALIAEGRTLEQVKAADPTQGYARRYGADTGPWTTTMFVEDHSVGPEHRGVALGQRAFSGNTEHRAQYQTIWAHSMMTAIATRRLAVFASVPGETAFLAGLIHDIGKVVVLRGIATLRKKDPLRFKVDDHTIPEFMDARHCSVGDILCRAWNIPDDLRDAVTNHHQGTLSGRAGALTAVVQMADLMATKIGASLRPDPKLTLVDKPAAGLLRLDDVKIASLVVDLEDEFEKVMAIL